MFSRFSSNSAVTWVKILHSSRFEHYWKLEKNMENFYRTQQDICFTDSFVTVHVGCANEVHRERLIRQPC